MRLQKLLSAAVLSLGLLAQPAIAHAAVPPPTLSDEFLIGNPPQLSANCNPTGTSTVRFVVTGVATGPYPGTFTETGTATIQPGTPVGTFGPVTNFQAVFFINSPVGRVIGTKSLISDPFLAGNLGLCSPGLTSFGVATNYKARILTNAGTFSDQGVTTAALNAPGLGGVGGDFLEHFVSSLQVVGP